MVASTETECCDSLQRTESLLTPLIILVTRTAPEELLSLSAGTRVRLELKWPAAYLCSLHILLLRLLRHFAMVGCQGMPHPLRRTVPAALGCRSIVAVSASREEPIAAGFSRCAGLAREARGDRNAGRKRLSCSVSDLVHSRGTAASCKALSRRRRRTQECYVFEGPASSPAEGHSSSSLRAACR